MQEVSLTSTGMHGKVKSATFPLDLGHLHEGMADAPCAGASSVNSRVAAGIHLYG